MKKMWKRNVGNFPPSLQFTQHAAVDRYLALSRGDKTTVCAIIPQWSRWDFVCPHHQLVGAVQCSCEYLAWLHEFVKAQA